MTFIITLVYQQALIMKIKSYFIALNTLIIGTVFCQCPNQVSNLSGTSIVNNIEVSVTGSGIFDSDTGCESASPYYIGGTMAGLNGSGSYTFNFFPAINYASLNFAGISSSQFWGADEEVQLTVNGLHYAIQTPGNTNTCGEPLSVLTAEGNIGGCSECSISGWQTTVINGPIYTLTVRNETLSGFPYGSVFSLYICDDALTNVEFIEQKITFLPNPFSHQAKLQTNIDLNNSTVKLYNLYGQIVEQISNVSGNSVIIERGSLQSGTYILKVILDGEILITQKVIIKDN